MTTFVAVRNNTGAVMVTDSQLTMGDMQLNFDEHGTGCSKFETIPDSGVLIVPGPLCAVQFIAEGMNSSDISFREKKNRTAGYLAVRNYLVEAFGYGLYSNDGRDFPSMAFCMYALYPDVFVEIGPDGAHMDHYKFVAGGSGLEFAYGALECLYANNLEPLDIAEQALLVAAKYDTGTSVDPRNIPVHFFKEEEKPAEEKGEEKCKKKNSKKS